MLMLWGSVYHTQSIPCGDPCCLEPYRLHQSQIVLRHRSFCHKAFASFHQWTANACSVRARFGSRKPGRRWKPRGAAASLLTLEICIFTASIAVSLIIAEGHHLAPSLYTWRPSFLLHGNVVQSHTGWIRILKLLCYLLYLQNVFRKQWREKQQIQRGEKCLGSVYTWTIPGN